MIPRIVCTNPARHTTSLIPHTLSPPSQILSRESKLRSPSRITKDDELRLEEDITEDGQSNPSVALKPTEAAAARRGGCVIHIASRHNGLIAFDAESEVGEVGRAREDVTTISLAVGRSRHLRVIVRDEVIWQEEKGCSGVGDGGEAVADCGSRANRVPASCEGPEALRVVHSGVGDLASVLARVNIAEVVASRRTLLQVCREERGVEAGLGVGEESLCLVGLDGIDRAEGEAKKTIALVLSEFRADLLGQLDGLTSDSCTANVDDIGVDVAAG